MGGSRHNHGNPSVFDQAAGQLLELARRRVTEDKAFTTVGEIVDAGLPWEDPDPFTRHLVWMGPDAVETERMAATVRALLPPSVRDRVSAAHLLQQVKELAFELGQSLLDHRDQDRTRRDARQLLQVLVERLAASDERWDVVLPIINLRLRIQGRTITIGPVQLGRDSLSRYVVHGDNAAALGEFGRWAVEHFALDKPENRNRWSGTLGEIAAYGKVVGLRGDRQSAIERAKRDIDTALAILRVSYYLYGSWSGRERFGTYGSFFDPVQRFGVMGTTGGGLRITLTAKATSEADGTAQSAPREPGEFEFSMARTDLLHPVEVTEAELHRRWSIIEQLAEICWSEDGRWRELATAARWFAEGTEAATAEDAFVKYVVALDMLLGREERGYAESQVTRISERLAFLLGEADPDRRWRLFNVFKTFYSKRSGIVHGGASTDEVELYRMESIARLAILRMAWEIRHRGHRNLDAFVDWVRRVKFGEPLEPIEVPPFLQLSDSWFENPH